MKEKLKLSLYNIVCKCHGLLVRTHLVEKEGEPDIIKYTCCMTGLICEGVEKSKGVSR